MGERSMPRTWDWGRWAARERAQIPEPAPMSRTVGLGEEMGERYRASLRWRRQTWCWRSGWGGGR